MLLALLLAIALSGCASTREADTTPDKERVGAAAGTPEEEDDNDPLEGLNRVMFSFNDKLDRYFMKPIAKGYRAITPRFFRTGVSNFFNNLAEPISILNGTLQGKFGDAASDLGRFVTNSTVGVFGLFDVATSIGLEPHDEDFGQTLGVWGVAEGPYLILPVFGPSNVRDGVGLVGDYMAHPVNYIDDRSTASKTIIVWTIDTRYRLLEAGDILDQAAGDDPYTFLREAYRQRRQSQIKDGAAEGPSQVDPSIFEDEPPKTPK